MAAPGDGGAGGEGQRKRPHEDDHGGFTGGGGEPGAKRFKTASGSSAPAAGVFVDVRHGDRAAAEGAADFYNRQTGRTREERDQGPIAKLREFNNWIKSVLIVVFARKDGFSVMDMACGKGGDLLKFKHANVGFWFAVDISPASVREAVDRYNAMAVRPFMARFVIADCGLVPLERIDGLMSVNFDLVSCQFAMHYFFATEARARCFFRNVSCRLVPGAHFVATTPNANELLTRLHGTAGEGRRFGNSLYYIEFAERVPLLQENGVVTCAPEHEFGCQYFFHLADVVDYPEFVVWPHVLARLANEYDMDVRLIRPFHKFAGDYVTNTRMQALHQYRKCFDAAGKSLLSVDEQEVVGVYCVVVLQKRGRHVLNPIPAGTRIAKYDQADVVDLSGYKPSAE